MKTKKKELLIKENYLNDAVFMSELTLKVQIYLNWFSYKILEIQDIYIHKNKIVYSIQVSYSFPPISVEYSIKCSTIKIVINKHHIDEIN